VKRLKMTRLFMLASVLVAGCASQGSDYLGKWVNTKDDKDTMEIIRNGDGYLLVGQGGKLPAIYKDGALQLQGPFGSVPLTYVKSTHTLMASGGLLGQSEYKHMK
jgi:hypothetical protein